jgi:hypothetical protein
VAGIEGWLTFLLSPVASVTPGGPVGDEVGVGVGVGVGVAVPVGVGDGLGVGEVLALGVGLGDVEPLPQAAPFTENAVGLELLPLTDPLNPIVALPPVARAPFQLSLVTVTFSPDWDQVPFQPLDTCWLPGNVNARVQLVIAEPLLVIVTLPVKPPGQLLGTE